MANDRETCRAKIMEAIRAEVNDPSVVFDSGTPIEDLRISSMDVINIIFRVEEAFGISVELPDGSQFKTVGDFVNALMKFIPLDDAAHA